MTIKKGETWGFATPLPENGVLIWSDTEAHHVINEARRSGSAVPPLGLLGGDLARSLGSIGREERLFSSDAQTRNLDLIRVEFNSETSWFVAHLIARRRFWYSEFVIAANVEFVGPMRAAPRAHPNDGIVDVLQGALNFDDRLKARHRVRTGDHLPHPNLSMRRVRSLEVKLARETPIWLDGIRYPKASRFTLEVEPDAAICVV